MTPSMRMGVVLLGIVGAFSLAARWKSSPCATQLREEAIVFVQDAVQLLGLAKRIAKKKESEFQYRRLFYYVRADAYLSAALRLVPSMAKLGQLTRVNVQELKTQLHTLLPSFPHK